ncbi:DUF2723 domain-containing protein [Candidatus Fermentibacteria bacterium]|nr:DUF2723 domain-containing protein [Candidatus Fermentibacteria bacterium]
MKPILTALAAGILVLTAYAATMLPDVGWDDTPELALAAECHGIPHSPGFPLFVLLSRAVKVLSGVSGARAASWVAAVSGASAAAVLAGILAARAGVALGLAGGFALGASPVVWMQGTHGEVYTLQVLLTMILIALATAMSSPRAALGAGYVFGLALGNHPSAVAFAPVLFPLVRARLKPLAAGTALALSIFAILPLRSLDAPCIDWGSSRTIRGFLWIVTLQEFRSDALSGRLLAGGSLAGTFGTLKGFLNASLPPVTLGLSALALPVLIRRMPLVVLSGGLLAAVAVTTGGGPDVIGYLLPLCPLIIGSAILAVGVLRFPRMAAAIAICSGTALLVAPLLPRLDRSTDLSACDYRDALASQLEGRVLFTDSSTDLFLMLHHAWSQHTRPRVVYTPYLGLAWYRSTLDPRLSAALPAQPDPPYASISRAAEAAGLQPVFTFSQLPDETRGLLIPEGWLSFQGSYDHDEDRAALARWADHGRPGSQGGRHRALRMAQGAQLLAAVSQHQSAVQRFAWALQTDSGNRAIWYSLVVSLAKMGRCEDLGRGARSFIRCGPLPVVSAELLASAVESLRGPCPTVTALSESLATSFPSSVSLTAHATRRALADGDPGRALRILASHKGQSSTEILNLRGVSLMLTGAFDQALTRFAQAMTRGDPSMRPLVAANMALCLRRLGRHAEADSLLASHPVRGRSP